MQGKVENDTRSELVIIWTSGDPDVFNKFVYMYACNSLSKGWWPAVRLVIWGPSVRLAAGDEEIMIRLTGLRKAGVRIESCRASSDDFGVSGILERL